MGSDLRLEYNATGYVPTALDKAAFYGVQVDQDLFDAVKSRFATAGSDSMMPVGKDPFIAGQGKTENIVRQCVVVPSSSDRPAAATAAPAAAAPAPPAQTPGRQEAMRKLTDAARAAVADLQAPSPSPPAETSAAPAFAAQPPSGAPPSLVYPRSAPAGQGFEPATPLPAAAYSPVSDSHPYQALEAATAMARATTALGQLAAASNGFTGMLPTIRAAESGQTGGASRRIQAVIESIITRRGLSLRLAPPLTEAFEGAELKASDYASQNKISKDSAGREMRLAAEAGLLQTVRYPQGEAGFRASQGLLREIAEGLGQPLNAAAPLPAETIIGSLAVAHTQGTDQIRFTAHDG